MAGIICKQCGYENPEGSVICEVCAEDLILESDVSKAQGTTTDSSEKEKSAEAMEPNEGNVEYFVMCPESQTKTVLPSGKETVFYCEGCKKQHEIDGFLWMLESRSLGDTQDADSDSQADSCKKESGDDLFLEEINSHVRIAIDKTGGTLGRYGTFGADFFQSRNLLTVSGEHCQISYEYGNWVLRHISRTNQTKYNGMILGSNEPNLLEDGKMLTLANSVTFVVRIE